jgi:hypothetical protein
MKMRDVVPVLERSLFVISHKDLTWRRSHTPLTESDTSTQTKNRRQPSASHGTRTLFVICVSSCALLLDATAVLETIAEEQEPEQAPS